MELDPEVRDFLDESDRFFGPDHDRLPLSEQRRIYDDWCRTFSAPLSADVVCAEVLIPASAAAGTDAPVRAVLHLPRSAAASGRLPVIIYYHGGGWILGSPETHAMVTSELARRVGAAVLSVDYRLAPEHPFPAAFNDAYAALLWAGRHAGADARLDPERLAVAGDSAGANLAAAVALASRDRRGPQIALQALVYPALKAKRRRPVVDSEGGGSEESISRYVEAYAGGTDIARIPYAMPLSAWDFAGLAPAFIAGAGIDAVREDSDDYAAALRQAGTPVAHRCAEALPHSYLRCIHLCRAPAAEFEALCEAFRGAFVPAASKTVMAG